MAKTIKRFMNSPKDVDTSLTVYLIRVHSEGYLNANHSVDANKNVFESVNTRLEYYKAGNVDHIPLDMHSSYAFADEGMLNVCRLIY